MHNKRRLDHRHWYFHYITSEISGSIFLQLRFNEADTFKSGLILIYYDTKKDIYTEENSLMLALI